MGNRFGQNYTDGVGMPKLQQKLQYNIYTLLIIAYYGYNNITKSLDST